MHLPVCPATLCASHKQAVGMPQGCTWATAAVELALAAARSDSCCAAAAACTWACSAATCSSSLSPSALGAAGSRLKLQEGAKHASGSAVPDSCGD